MQTELHKQQGIQTAAVLLLCRFVLFACGESPFTAGYAVGTLLSIGVQALLCFPLWIGVKAETLPRWWLIFYRLAAVYAAGVMLAALYRLLLGLQSAHPVLTLLLLLIAACYALILPRPATGRVAMILLFFLCVGLLLTICLAAARGEPLLLYTPMPRDTFWETALAGFAQNLPLMFVPVCAIPYGTSPRRCRPWLLGWCLGQLMLVLVILAGTLCSGKLSQWQGNPFFLLMAKLQQNAAIRTDGFWIVLLLLSGVMSLAFLMQIVTATRRKRTLRSGEALFIGFIMLLAGILCSYVGVADWVTGAVILVTAGILPLMALLKQIRCRLGRRHT